MRRLLVLALIFFATASYASGPRSWGKSGTATVANAQVTVGGTAPFYPAAICISNTGGTNNLYANWTTGVASTTDNTGNLLIAPSDKPCLTFGNPNVGNTMVIGLITNAGTTTYNIISIGAR